jgi:HEPN domain-containing protein
MSVTVPQQWLDIATEDLTVARLVVSEGHTAHAQCIEKALKAFLLAQTNSYPRTHKLVDLLNQCVVLQPSFNQFETDCIRMDEFYIPTRYPDAIPGGLPDGFPGVKRANIAIHSAATILHFVTEQIAGP